MAFETPKIEISKNIKVICNSYNNTKNIDQKAIHLQTRQGKQIHQACNLLAFSNSFALDQRQCPVG